MADVEVVATLQDYGDNYDPKNRIVALCLRTILALEPADAVDEIRRLIRFELDHRRAEGHRR